jgi:hypothetical protein
MFNGRGMLLKTDYSLVDILKETKTIINNSNEYNNYMIRYNCKGSRNSQKLPLSSISLKLYNPFKKNRYLDITTEGDSKSNIFKDRRVKLTMGLNSPRNDNPISIFFAQSEVLINDLSYYDKEYKYNEIYRKDDYYVNMLTSKLEELKNQKNEAKVAVLEKDLQGKCHLSLTSLEIKFVNLTETAKPIFVRLPFALLPVFYFVNIETFKMLLITILRFTDDTYSSIELDINQIYNALITWHAYNTEYNTIKFDNNNIYKFHWMTNKCIFDVYIR